MSFSLPLIVGAAVLTLIVGVLLGALPAAGIYDRARRERTRARFAGDVDGLPARAKLDRQRLLWLLMFFVGNVVLVGTDSTVGGVVGIVLMAAGLTMLVRTR